MKCKKGAESFARVVRELHSMQQKDMAKILGISPRGVRRIEAEGTSGPSRQMLVLMARYPDFEGWSWLLDGGGDE